MWGIVRIPESSGGESIYNFLGVVLSPACAYPVSKCVCVCVCVRMRACVYALSEMPYRPVDIHAFALYKPNNLQAYKCESLCTCGISYKEQTQGSKVRVGVSVRSL